MASKKHFFCEMVVTLRLRASACLTRKLSGRSFSKYKKTSSKQLSLRYCHISTDALRCLKSGTPNILWTSSAESPSNSCGPEISGSLMPFRIDLSGCSIMTGAIWARSSLLFDAWGTVALGFFCSETVQALRVMIRTALKSIKCSREVKLGLNFCDLHQGPLYPR
jgi:hypothetical protein